MIAQLWGILLFKNILWCYCAFYIIWPNPNPTDLIGQNQGVRCPPYAYFLWFLIPRSFLKYIFTFISADHEDLDDGLSQGRLSTDIYSGQPLDREPNMGQVPLVPPGTPPMDGWGHHHYNGLVPVGHFMGRHSPNVPMPHQMPLDPMNMVGGPTGGRMMAGGSDLNDNSSFSDYSASSQNHVEVYWYHPNSTFCIWNMRRVRNSVRSSLTILLLLLVIDTRIPVPLGILGYNLTHQWTLCRYRPYFTRTMITSRATDIPLAALMLCVPCIGGEMMQWIFQPIYSSCIVRCWNAIDHGRRFGLQGAENKNKTQGMRW